jgi:hypothetical protein
MPDDIAPPEPTSSTRHLEELAWALFTASIIAKPAGIVRQINPRTSITDICIGTTEYELILRRKA